MQAAAGAVVGGGAGAAVLRNQNGVEIALTATVVVRELYHYHGAQVRLAMAGSGMNIKLK